MKANKIIALLALIVLILSGCSTGVICDYCSERTDMEKCRTIYNVDNPKEVRYICHDCDIYGRCYCYPCAVLLNKRVDAFRYRDTGSYAIRYFCKECDPDDYDRFLDSFEVKIIH